MVWPLLRLGCGGGRAQAGVQLGQRAMSPLAVLFKSLRLHYLATMAAHYQVEVIVAGVEAKDGHVWGERTHVYHAPGGNTAVSLCGAGRDAALWKDGRCSHFKVESEKYPVKSVFSW